MKQTRNWKGNKNVDQYVVRVQGKITDIVLLFFLNVCLNDDVLDFLS